MVKPMLLNLDLIVRERKNLMKSSVVTSMGSVCVDLQDDDVGNVAKFCFLQVFLWQGILVESFCTAFALSHISNACLIAFCTHSKKDHTGHDDEPRWHYLLTGTLECISTSVHMWSMSIPKQ
jgi:hypothetical protein